MRLFKSNNKSQASIDRLPNSRSSSPDPAHLRSSYIAAGGATQHFTDRPGFQPQPPLHPADDLHSTPPYPQDTPGVPHPAHVLTRVPSEGQGGYVESARRPSIQTNIVPPISPQPPPHQQGPAPIPGQTQFGQSKQVYVPVEKEHKRSKRSIFGLTSSKDKERDKDKENLHSPTDKRPGGLGRSGSIHLLRRSHHQSQPSELHSPSSPLENVRQSAYFGRSNQSLDDSPEDPSHYEQYRTQQQQYQHPPPQQQNYDSPTSQYSHQSPDDAQYPRQQRFPPPPDRYQPYHQHPDSPTTSDHYLPYQPEPPQGRPSAAVLAEQQSLRPPSQTSLGPPSPVAGHPPDSRPSTAQTSRYSGQSAGPGLVQQAQYMARGEPPNGNNRQHMPQRDPRDELVYQQDPRVRMSQHQGDQGRNTPPPRSSNREDPRDLDYNQLLQKYEELQQKYSKVKRYYFEREAQVTQLQNTVATQRISMSKTSLDDAQYSQRFERLSGAINNLAFNIRKDWKKVPPWLQPVCNNDAQAVGTKEMTGVGRACITRWLNETIFQQIFHPGVPYDVSQHLKSIERTLRSQASSGLMFTDEQRDDHLAKLTTWRLTTIEGLSPYLNSKDATTHQDNLTTKFTNDLTGSLRANLKDPPPPGLHEGVATIISQAISLAANIPLESRDVVITYFMPGESINENLMKLETGMTALTAPGPHPSQQTPSQSQPDLAPSTTTDNANNSSADSSGPDTLEEQIREAAAKATSSARAESVTSLGSNVAKQGSGASEKSSSGGKSQQKGSSFLGGFVSKKPAPSSQGGAGGRGSIARGPAETPQQQQQQQQQPSQQESQAEAPPAGVSQQQQQPGYVMGEGRIRFAAFLAVEVRGKVGGGGAAPKDGQQQQGGAAGAGQVEGKGAVNVLCKAPVYEL